MPDEFTLVITASAKKRLRKHRHAEAQILRALLILQQEPETGHTLSGNLREYRSLKIFVKGSGEYRALYEVRPEQARVIVHWIGPRENFYEGAERNLLG